jgi:putative redox protein
MNTDLDHVTADTTAILRETGRLKTELRTRDFSFIADDPDGDDAGAGPTPTEYLIMALASCTAQTLRQYADRKYDYAGDITVRVALHEPRYDGAERYLQRTISLTEEIPAEDLETMKEIAERSPVTLLLAYAWSVRTDFSEAAGLPDARAQEGTEGHQRPPR